MPGKYKLALPAPAAQPLKSDARRKKIAHLGPASPALLATRAWKVKQSEKSGPSGPASPAIKFTKKK
ncbi:MAG TPA: hypothetical protein VIO16_04405 [Dehalococcoidia bacterium]|jgi:hypothetical protein